MTVTVSYWQNGIMETEIFEWCSFVRYHKDNNTLEIIKQGKILLDNIVAFDVERGAI